MANYESVTRSNYFHVKDEDAFIETSTRLKSRDSRTPRKGST